MAIKFFVCLLKAAVSDATKISPCAKPITMGDPLQATTMLSGSALFRIAKPHVPSHLREGVPKGQEISPQLFRVVHAPLERGWQAGR